MYLHLIESQINVPIVLYFVLQKILTHVKQVVRSGPAFCNCSIIYFSLSVDQCSGPKPTLYSAGKNN